MTEVNVNTDVGGYFASLQCGDVLVEFSKDGDSPACPLSWTWCMWHDGNYIDGTIEEMSLARSVKNATAFFDAMIEDLTSVRDYLNAYGVFGKEPAPRNEAAKEGKDDEE